MSETSPQLWMRSARRSHHLACCTAQVTSTLVSPLSHPIDFMHTATQIQASPVSALLRQSTRAVCVQVGSAWRCTTQRPAHRSVTPARCMATAPLWVRNPHQLVLMYTAFADVLSLCGKTLQAQSCKTALSKRSSSSIQECWCCVIDRPDKLLIHNFREHPSMCHAADSGQEHGYLVKMTDDLLIPPYPMKPGQNITLVSRYDSSIDHYGEMLLQQNSGLGSLLQAASCKFPCMGRTMAQERVLACNYLNPYRVPIGQA